MDISYLLFLQQFREITGGIFNSFFLFITELGANIWPLLVTAGIYWCINKKIGQYLLLNNYISGWINGVVKLTVCAYRPWVRSADIHPVDEALTTATGYSFPSGHMANTVATWGGLAVSYRKTRSLRNALIILIVIIGFSRNYLGVHTPQDVLVSAATGIVLLFAIAYLQKWLDAKPGREIWVLSFSVAMCLFMILYASFKSYPMDYVDGELLVDPAKMAINSWKAGGEILGLGVGWFCEHKWVKFSTDGTVSEKLGRFLTGGLITAVLFYILPTALKMLMPAQAANIISQFFITMFVVCLFPVMIAGKQRKQRLKTEGNDTVTDCHG